MFHRKPRPKLAKKWEGDYTTIKKHYKHIIFPIGGVALAGVTVAAIFLPLYIKSKAEEGLGNFMDEGGTVPAFRKDQPINYVAMGDSITAGYNGFFHGSDDAPKSKDYLSYADFLAQDLKNAGLLNNYKNYAKSGDTIWDTNGLVDESQAVNHAIKDADLITISISSNDLLGAVSVLGLPFATSINKIMGNVQLPNHLRDAIFPGSNSGIGGSDTNKLVADAMKKAADLLYKGKTTGIMDIRDGYQKTILDIVKRGLMILTRDMHQAAPKAHIKFIMPEFPLLGISKSLETEATPNTGKSVIEFYEKDFFNAVKEGINAQYTSFDWFHNGFTDYVNNLDGEYTKLKAKSEELNKEITEAEVNQNKFLYAASEMEALPGQHGGYPKPSGLVYVKPTEIKISTHASTLTDAQLKSIFLSKELLKSLEIKTDQTINQIRDQYMNSINNKKALYNIYNNEFIQYKGIHNRYSSIKTDRTRTIIANEFMNDFADIHPSTRGHQVMGNYIFSKLLPSLTSNPAKPLEELYQFAVPYSNDGKIESFEELDQILWGTPNADGDTSKINGQLYLANSELDGSTVAILSRAINRVITQHPTGMSSPLKDLLSIIKPLISGHKDVSTDLYKIDLSKGMFDNLCKIKGATPGFNAQSFLGSLVKDGNTEKATVAADDEFWATLATILNQELVVSPDAQPSSDPNAENNGQKLAKDLEGFNMANLFGSKSIGAVDDLKDIFTEIGIKTSGNYAASLELDWTALETKLTDSNSIVNDVINTPYLLKNVKTLGDLLSTISKSKTISLFRTFILDKIPHFLSDEYTENFKDLPTMYERSIELANDWGLVDLANQLQKSADSVEKLETFFSVMAKYSSFKESELKGAQSSMNDQQIIDLVNSDIDKGSDKAQNAKAKQEVQNAYDAYTASTAGKPVTMNSGFQALFNLLHITLQP